MRTRNDQLTYPPKIIGENLWENLLVKISRKCKNLEKSKKDDLNSRNG